MTMTDGADVTIVPRHDVTKQDHLSRLMASVPTLQAALAEGRDWESTPDDWQPGLPEMYPLEVSQEPFPNASEYVLVRVLRGAQLKSGWVIDVRWLVDAEGALLDEESCALNDDESYSAWYAGFGPPGIMDEWRRDITNIVATGNDSLGFLTVPPASDSGTQEWEVRVTDSMEVHGYEGAIVRAARRKNCRRWLEVAALPEHVRVVLVGGRIDATRLLGIHSLHELKVLARIDGRDRGVVVPGTLVALPHGIWTFRALVGTDPLELRATRAATEWLAARRAT
jgi:hypothetical protein